MIFLVYIVCFAFSILAAYMVNKVLYILKTCYSILTRFRMRAAVAAKAGAG